MGCFLRKGAAMAADIEECQYYLDQLIEQETQAQEILGQMIKMLEGSINNLQADVSPVMESIVSADTEGWDEYDALWGQVDGTMESINQRVFGLFDTFSDLKTLMPDINRTYDDLEMSLKGAVNDAYGA